VVHVAIFHTITELLHSSLTIDGHSCNISRSTATSFYFIAQQPCPVPPTVPGFVLKPVGNLNLIFETTADAREAEKIVMAGILLSASLYASTFASTFIVEQPQGSMQFQFFKNMFHDNLPVVDGEPFQDVDYVLVEQETSDGAQRYILVALVPRLAEFLCPSGSTGGCPHRFNYADSQMELIVARWGEKIKAPEALTSRSSSSSSFAMSRLPSKESIQSISPKPPLSDPISAPVSRPSSRESSVVTYSQPSVNASAVSSIPEAAFEPALSMFCLGSCVYS
jgi:hypothetical protein